VADQSKTERATPRRRQKAREQGQVARSRDLIAGVGSMAAVLLLGWQMPAFAGEWRGLLRRGLEAAARPDGSLPSARSSLVLFRGAAVAASLSWLLALVSGVGQGGLVVASGALTPSLDRLNPAKRLEQLFSLSALSRLLKSLVPAGVLVYLAAEILLHDQAGLVALTHATGAGAMAFAANHTFELAWKAALVLLIWAGADYLLERQRLENQLKMSRRDLMDEYKEAEGHPAVKARIRRLQRQARRRRMLKDVERAAVVITNPTEFAVALAYEEAMAAPLVVAKGRDLLAAQIKEVARWHSIPMVENPPLAHALYRAVEVGQAVPPKLYTVVAEILAAIYRAQQRAAQTAAAAAGRL